MTDAAKPNLLAKERPYIHWSQHELNGLRERFTAEVSVRTRVIAEMIEQRATFEKKLVLIREESKARD